MPPSTERALRAAITRRTFEPVYYLHGDEDFRKDEAVAAIVAAAVDPALRDFNVEIRRGANVDGEVLETLLGTPPLMSDRRAVVIRNVAALKKDARGVLDRYLEHPASNAVVVLVAVAGGKPDKALVDRAAAIDLGALTGDRLGDWITRRAESLGVTISAEGAALLQDGVGNDLGQLAAELDKLASYVNASDTRVIDERAVSAIVGVVRDETLGRLLDLVAARDAAGALVVLPQVLALPKTTAVSIVMALTTQTLALAYAAAGGGRSAGEFFGLLKDTGAFPGRAWGEAVSAWVKAAPAWSEPALGRALDALLAADVALKETRVSDDEQILVSLILRLCADVSRREGRAA